MQFRLLGAMDVRTDDGDPIPIAAPKRRALLAALLLENEGPVSTQRLAEALWGDDPPPARPPASPSIEVPTRTLPTGLPGTVVDPLLSPP